MVFVEKINNGEDLTDERLRQHIFNKGSLPKYIGRTSWEDSNINGMNFLIMDLVCIYLKKKTKL